MKTDTEPATIDCPECSEVLEKDKRNGKYFCQRCGVVWRWIADPFSKKANQ
jgi:transcription initiation factor TFIIIB Brf1 subunit/transcription initiation factor TFIIB